MASLPSQPHSDAVPLVGPLVGHGASADVYAWAGAGPPGAMVVKAHRGDGGSQKTLAEAAALSAVSHRHVVQPAGITEVNGRPALLLPRLDARSARDWLDRRGRISPGEAVTLLVPLLLVLVHLERRGLHPSVDLAARISLESVLFDDAGAPVVVGLRAVPPRGIERVRLPGGGVHGAAQRLVHGVLAATEGGPDETREALLDMTHHERRVDLDELIETVFELGAPAPLSDSTATTGVERARAEPKREVPVRREPTRGVDGTLDAVLPWWPGLRDTLAHAVRGGRLGAALRQVRPRVWFMAGLVVASVVVAAVLLDPEPSAPPLKGGSSPPAHREATPIGSPRALPPSSSPDASPTHRSGSDVAAGSPMTRDDAAAALTGDDAEAAAVVLLSLRAECLRALDQACLAGIEQAGTPLLERDEAAVQYPRLVDGLVVDMRITALTNGLGGAALFAATTRDDKPASVLVSRTEAGWRLRSIAVK